MAGRLAAITALALAGCFVEVDFGNTRFACVEQPVCPGDLECVDGVCVPPGTAVDAGVDAPAGGAVRQIVSVVADLGQPLADAPVLIRLTPERVDYPRIAAGGGDLRFVAGDGAPLAHEIERWDPDGESIVWVKLPVLEARATFSMIYGDGETGVEQPAELWSAYDLVYHLSDSAADSRSGRDATAQGGAATGPARLAGGALLDGVDDYFEIGADLPLLRAVPAATVSVWIRADELRGSMFEAAITTGETSRLFVNIQADGAPRLGIRTQDVDGPALLASGLDLVATGEWTWLLYTAEFAAQTAAVYVDGVESARVEMLAFDPMTPDTNSALAVIGADDGLAAGGFFPGAIDELRVASRAVDAAWAEAQYLSMTDALLSFGPPEPL